MDEAELVEANSCHPFICDYVKVSCLALFSPEPGCVVACCIAQFVPTLILVTFNLDQELCDGPRSQRNKEIRGIHSILAASLFKEADRERLAHDAKDLWCRSADYE